MPKHVGKYYPLGADKCFRYNGQMQWASLIFLTILASVSSLAAPAQRPNVLLICVDDLKPVLGCYGDELARSPNIDRLARRGMLFERAYCNQAVCAPSRNALLTGMRPTSLGIYDLGTHFRLAAPEAVTLPQYFMGHGYRAEALGKIFHVGHGNHDDRASWSVPHWAAKVVAYASPQNRATKQLSREEALFDNVPDAKARKLPRGAPYEAADVSDDSYPDGLIASEAIRRLRNAKQKSDEPFFLAVGFVKPHLPFCAPKKYWDLYRREEFPLSKGGAAPEGAPEYALHASGELRQYRDVPGRGPMPEDLQRTLIHGYYAAVSYMDAQVGRVLDELDRLGLDNTIVVLWGDHGWHLGDHGLWCKHTNYEQATRIPLIVRVPGAAKSGARSRALVETVDLFPTLCELAALPKPQLPQQLDGTSFVRTLKRSSETTKDAIFHVYPRNPKGKGPILGRGVRTERYRLIEWKKPGAPADSADLELYDYSRDPAETRNLAAEQPTIAVKLRAILEQQGEAKPQWRKSNAN